MTNISTLSSRPRTRNVTRALKQLEQDLKSENCWNSNCSRTTVSQNRADFSQRRNHLSHRRNSYAKRRNSVSRMGTPNSYSQMSTSRSTSRSSNNYRKLYRRSVRSQNDGECERMHLVCNCNILYKLYFALTPK